jgi:cytochrome oxidase assembly protein ShyY1
VGLGAICDLGPQRPDDARAESFSVSEFVTLQDGRRVILHEDRGFTTALRSTGRTDPGELREHTTIESLTRDVLNVVLPDDDVPAESHPWAWLADLARARGLNVSADDLRSLPYEVTFTDDVRRWLAPA